MRADRDPTTQLLMFQSSAKRDFYVICFNKLVKALNVLNLIDSIFTLFWVNSGVAEEANIFLKDLVEENALLFIIVKIALVSMGSLLLWRFKWRFLALAGLILVFTTYSFVFIYHLHILNLYLIT